jgi:hypothetical protein
MMIIMPLQRTDMKNKKFRAAGNIYNIIFSQANINNQIPNHKIEYLLTKALY